MVSRNILLIGGGGILTLTLAGEIYLTTQLGMANAPLYEESDKWEYMAKPNQDGVRFSNH